MASNCSACNVQLLVILVYCAMYTLMFASSTTILGLCSQASLAANWEGGRVTCCRFLSVGICMVQYEFSFAN